MSMEHLYWYLGNVLIFPGHYVVSFTIRKNHPSVLELPKVLEQVNES